MLHFISRQLLKGGCISDHILQKLQLSKEKDLLHSFTHLKLQERFQAVNQELACKTHPIKLFCNSGPRQSERDV
ncbi:MAG: hypothetical protein ACD_17C00024G0002 [uncultured bacterium]|nr:MAG: hypothetical protein ACD_17C00024G0002 [uncultured bacterium]